MIKNTYLILCWLSLTVLAPTAKATSIEKLEFDAMASTSEVIFQGEVVSVKARWNEASTDIHTYVTFRVDDTIKGSISTQQLELRFAGGKVGDDNVVYQGLVYPNVGEVGIYFVETLEKNLINPLTGWSQGHFKVVGSQVMTNEDKPLMALTRSSKVVPGEFSHGTASGVQVGSDGDTGMSAANFKDQIKAAMNRAPR